MIILVHDLGTSSNKAALYSEDGELIAASSQSYSTFETQHGASEQNPAEWLQAVASTTKRVILTSGVRSSDIEAICVSGHMMGVVALDSYNLPIRSAILHGDTRSHPQVKAIAEHMPASRAHQISGNPLDVHYPLSKIAWLRDNEPSVYKEARVFVQSKDYITGWLTGRDAVTDYSDASLYGCFDFHTMTWSEELCQAAGIDMGKLPRILQAGSVVGKLCSEAAKALDIASGIPVYLGFGDGAAAAYGAGAWEPGSCYNYVGSTAWVAATTAIPAIDPDERLFTIALTSERFSSIG
ncbi:MAG: FGGY family carbohydrate kinase, partial [Armatimonadota bacterium]